MDAAKLWDETVERKIDYVNRRLLDDCSWHYINTIWPSRSNSVIAFNVTGSLSTCLRYTKPISRPLFQNTFFEYWSTDVFANFQNTPLQCVVHEIEEDPDPRLQLSSSSSGYHSLSGSLGLPSPPTNGSRRPSLSSSTDSTSPDESLIRRLSLINEDMNMLGETQLEQQPITVPPPSRPQQFKVFPNGNNGRTRYGSGRFKRGRIIQNWTPN